MNLQIRSKYSLLHSVSIPISQLVTLNIPSALPSLHKKIGHLHSIILTITIRPVHSQLLVLNLEHLLHSPPAEPTLDSPPKDRVHLPLQPSHASGIGRVTRTPSFLRHAHISLMLRLPTH